MEKLLWWSRASLRWQCQPEAEEPQPVCRRRPQTSDPFDLSGRSFQNTLRLLLGVIVLNWIRTSTGQLDPECKLKCTMEHILLHERRRLAVHWLKDPPVGYPATPQAFPKPKHQPKLAPV